MKVMFLYYDDEEEQQQNTQPTKSEVTLPPAILPSPKKTMQDHLNQIVRQDSVKNRPNVEILPEKGRLKPGKKAVEFPENVYAYCQYSGCDRKGERYLREKMFISLKTGLLFCSSRCLQASDEQLDW